MKITTNTILIGAGLLVVAYIAYKAMQGGTLFEGNIMPITEEDDDPAWRVSGTGG